jgi:signal transduction histidine kinase
MNLQPETPNPADRFAWLKRLNNTVSQWAASLSWWRMMAVIIIATIAGSMIGEKFRLSHDVEPPVKVKRKAASKSDTPAAERECEGDEVRIGGKNGIVICEGRRVKKKAEPAAAPGAASSAPEGVVAQGASAAESTASEPAPAASSAQSKKGKGRAIVTIDTDDEDDFDAVQRKVTRTFAGYVGDFLSAVLVAAIAYLIAAKVIMRKTAEADAKLKVATEGTEREAMQRQLVQARLKLLQAQVEPHFLFNTLAAVDYLIETDPKRASVMQKTLIGYLRAALPQMRQESSNLGRELKLVRSYLELLKLRIEDRLEFEIKVPPNLESAVFPPMVLQTLIENAIKHGIEPKPEGGRITVMAEVIDQQLRVDVIDTGVGLPDGDIFGSNKNGSGLGLDNIRNRLALLYPGKSRMELSSGYEGGTMVRLLIPYAPETRSTEDAFK